MDTNGFLLCLILFLLSYLVPQPPPIPANVRLPRTPRTPHPVFWTCYALTCGTVIAAGVYQALWGS